MTKEQKNIVSPLNSSTSILMLMGKQCAYCGPMMQILTELMKAGELAELRIVNIEENPELARQLGVRSVPWLQIGPFELQGARSRQEIVLWLQRASNFEGMTEYLDEVLAEGNIGYANKLIQQYPQALENVIALMADPHAKINVSLGMGVIIEEMAEAVEFKVVVPL